MAVTFLLGPAGSGKTDRCIREVRAALDAGPDGAPLLFLAPKQATFQIERQILGSGGPAGFARLRILSFERLARGILEDSSGRLPRLISEETRVMVLRALIERHHVDLGVFRRSSRSPGFARQLSDFLRLLHRMGGRSDLRSEILRDLPATLTAKLEDSERLFREYQTWLAERNLLDPDALLPLATRRQDETPGPHLAGIWLDGFASLTPPEEDLLVALLKHHPRATLAFCTPGIGLQSTTPWSPVEDTVQRLGLRLESIGITPVRAALPRNGSGRFGASPSLAVLERQAARGILLNPGIGIDEPVPASLPIAVQECPDPHAEAEGAASAIEAFVADGGRYRDVAVLVRDLEPVAALFTRVFRRRGIPVFVDQREPITHHPLLELTRAALRVAAHDWNPEDIWAFLKSGLVGLDEWDADRIENQALAEGWSRRMWAGQPGAPSVSSPAEQAVAPLRRFCQETAARPGPDGSQLATALQRLWNSLPIEPVLDGWEQRMPDSSHTPVLRALRAWADEVATAFGTDAMPLTEWAVIADSALSGLSLGRVPPALDQVLLGGVDRSRNPDLTLVILPGWNEESFPAPIREHPLLPRHEAEQLARWFPLLAHQSVRHASEEAYLAYIGLTRARGRVLMSWSRRGTLGERREPSRFLRVLKPLSHATEPETRVPAIPRTEEPAVVRIDPRLRTAVFGTAVRMAPTRLETHAKCPFLGFVSRTMAAEERILGEFNPRHRGTLEHALLADFTRRCHARQIRWQELGDTELDDFLDSAVAECAPQWIAESPRSRLMLRQTRTLVAAFLRESRLWMQHYGLQPAEVELQIDRIDPTRPDRPVFRLSTSDGTAVRLVGWVDRVDVGMDPSGNHLNLVVIDYKHGPRKFRPRGIPTGLELQLPLYAGAARELIQWDRGTPTRVLGFAYAPLRAEKGLKNPPGRIGADVTPPHRVYGGKVAKASEGGSDPCDGFPVGVRSRAPIDEIEQLIQAAEDRASMLASEMLEGEARPFPHPELRPAPCPNCVWSRVCRHPL